MEKKIILDETALEKFDPTVATLQAMVEKTKDLKATDLKDKTQLETVRKARIDLKKTRVAIEKYGKDLRDDANKFSKAVIAKEKELIGIIEPEEDRLKAIEEEAEKLAIREERMEKLPARKERLAAIGDGVEVSDEDLLLMDANDFEGYFNARTADKLKADKEKAEADQRARDEEIRKENERKEAEIKAREDAAREKEEANAREEARLKAEKEAREREEKAREEEREKARKEEEERLEREKRAKEEAAKKEAEEKARLEKAERYRNWRAQFGWTEATRADFKEEKVGDTVVLWKKVDTFYLNGSPLQQRYDQLKKDLSYEKDQYEIAQKHPTDTDQFRRALEKHGGKIRDMELELAELAKTPGVIK